MNDIHTNQEQIDTVTNQEVQRDDLEVTELDIVMQTTEPTVEVIETVEVVEVEETPEVVIEVEEAVGWAGGDPNLHTSLAGRDSKDQHPISAITGLSDELDNIKALKTVYSDKASVANYYEWDEGAYDATGYFVSLVQGSTKIKLCDGGEIFGVTVDNAGFIGNQDAVAPKDNHYALVVTSGLVDVLCELDVTVGDFVVSNSRGIAEKTDTDCGYKVIAIESKRGSRYAVISLGVQASTTDMIGKRVQRIGERVDNAEINIGAAMNAAQNAFSKAVSSAEVSEEALLKALEALKKSDDTSDIVKDIEGVLSTVNGNAVQARAIAENAVTSAESIRGEAIATANDALSDVTALVKELEPITNWNYIDPVTGKSSYGAEYLTTYIKNGVATKAEVSTVDTIAKDGYRIAEESATSVSSMIASVDKYSVGPYSPAYGLTIAQARNILKVGMLYIPTAHENGATHKESYEGTEDREFTNGFYYEWVELDDGFGWSEALGEVWFGEEQPAGNVFDYWYDGATLFILQGGQWVEVATLAGNVNNRITSMIRQDVDEVRTEIVNAYGSIAGFGAELSETEAKVNSIASWPTEEGKHMLATIEQVADGDSSHLVLAAVTTDGTKPLDGATIVVNNDEDKSSIYLDADYITFNGTTKFLKPDDLGEGGSTEIDGARITTGYISANRIDVVNGSLTVTDEDGDVLFSAGNNKVQMAGWNVDENSLYTTFENDPSRIFLSTGTTGQYTIGGHKDYWYIGVGTNTGNGFGVTTSGILYANGADISGTINANDGYIGGWHIDNNVIESGNVQLCSSSNTSLDSLINNGNTSDVRISAGDDAILTYSQIHTVRYISDEGYARLGFTIKNDNIIDGSITVTSLTPDLVIKSSGQVLDDNGNILGVDILYVGGGDIEISYRYIKNDVGQFCVLNDGSVYASAVNLVGSVEASDGKIGNLKIKNGGLECHYNGTPQYCLNEYGLRFYKDISRIEVGDLSIGYDRESKDTIIQASGKFSIGSDNGTKLEFMKNNTGNTASGNITLYYKNKYTNSNGYVVADVWATCTGTPFYPIGINFEWQSEYMKTCNMSKTAFLKIDTNQTKSNTIEIVYSATMLQYKVRFKPKNGSWTSYKGDWGNYEDTFSFSNATSYSQTKSNNDLYLTGNFLPSVKSTSASTGYNLGFTDYLWNTVYARTSTIQSSDKNKKNTILPLSDGYGKIFDSLKPVSYKYNVNNNNRTHIGFVAQDVKEAVENAGLTTQDLAAYCEWTDEGGEIGCGLRYSEFIAMCVDQIQKLKKRVEELEKQS